MTRRFTVMGFTEAELGFVIAGVFAALTVAALEPRVDVQNERRTAVEKLAVLQRERDSLARLVDTLLVATKKRSNKTPGCAEKGQADEPIKSIRVLGRDLYEVDGSQLTFHEVEHELSIWITKSRQLGCRYRIIAFATPGVDGPDHSAAMVKLRLHFDAWERER